MPWNDMKNGANAIQHGGSHYKEKAVWAAVVGFEGLYEVSDHGEVRSLQRIVERPHPKNSSKVQRRVYGGCVLRPKINRNGYVECQLWNENKAHTRSVHRMVAEAFLGVKDGLEVNHLDGVKTNNKLTNIEWVTRSENHTHAYRKLGRIVPISGKISKTFERNANEH